MNCISRWKTHVCWRRHSKLFCARGAALGPEEKEKYRKLSSELSLLSLIFDQNALKDKNRYELLLTKEDELEGLPESIREAAALRAKEKGKTGWLFNLSAPSYVPFMRYSALRGLREKMYREYMSIGNKGDEYDNKEIIREIVNIRLENRKIDGIYQLCRLQIETYDGQNSRTRL